MLMSRIKAVMLSLLVVIVAGSIMTATAWSAEAGPFWHHRLSTKGEGEKIEPKAPENFRGAGGEQLFKARIGAVEIEFGSPSVQVKGAIFNGALQGQIKAEIVYSQPRLVAPENKECTVTIGEKNAIVTKGYLMWKWNGAKKQLEETSVKEQSVDGIFSANEPSHQKPFVEKVNLTKYPLTTVALAGTGCGVLVGKYIVTGSYVGIPNLKLGEFSKTVAIRVIEPPKENGVFLQHYYDGEGMQGAEVGLLFGGSPAAYFLGQTEVEAAQQEVAVFER